MTTSITGAPRHAAGAASSPNIRAVRTANVTDTSATILWTTDIPADSLVEYGPSTDYGHTVDNPDIVCDHDVTLTGLERNTLYHYRVISAARGARALSNDRVFVRESDWLQYLPAIYRQPPRCPDCASLTPNRGRRTDVELLSSTDLDSKLGPEDTNVDGVVYEEPCDTCERERHLPTGRFLRIFDDTLEPIRQLLDDLPSYFEPETAPAGMVPWLATWADLGAVQRLTIAQQRRLIRAAAELYRTRGTRIALKRYLGICTGVEPLVVENSEGLRLGPDARLGWNTRLAAERPLTATVTFPVDDPDTFDTDLAATAVREFMPAHLHMLLLVVRRMDRQSRT